MAVILQDVDQERKDWSAEIENNQTDEKEAKMKDFNLYFKHKFYPENGMFAPYYFMIIL